MKNIFIIRKNIELDTVNAATTKSYMMTMKTELLIE